MGNRFLRPLFFSFFLFAPLSGVHLFAQGMAAEPDADQREVRAGIYVHEILPYWQKRLRLEDWTISVLLSRPADLRPGTLGNIHWDADKKSAIIRVMDASGYTMAFVPMLKDMEFTIVHELIHLELASLPISDANRSDEEYAINHLTEALLKSEPAP